LEYIFSFLIFMAFVGFLLLLRKVKYHLKVQKKTNFVECCFCFAKKKKKKKKCGKK